MRLISRRRRAGKVIAAVAAAVTIGTIALAGCSAGGAAAAAVHPAEPARLPATAAYVTIGAYGNWHGSWPFWAATGTLIVLRR